MAKMTKCGDCGQQVSKSVKRCPNCGKKLTPRSVWIFGSMFAFIVLWFVISLSNTQPTNTENRYDTQEITALAEQEKQVEFDIVRSMNFDSCLKFQDFLETRMNVKSIPVESSGKIVKKKFCSNLDGPFVLTCDGKNNTRVMVKSDNDGC